MNVTGIHSFTINDKGRITIPSDLRKQLDGEVYLMPAVGPDNEGTLLLLHPDEFDKLKTINGNSKRTGQGARTPKSEHWSWWVVSGSLAVLLDIYDPPEKYGKKYGYVNIPLILRGLFNLHPNTEVVYCGYGDTIEIVEYKRWKARYQKHFDLVRETYLNR